MNSLDRVVAHHGGFRLHDAPAQPELGRWMNELRDLNPEMEAAHQHMKAEAVPEGVRRLVWAKRQAMELLRKAQTGEIESVAPPWPKPTLDDPG